MRRRQRKAGEEYGGVLNAQTGRWLRERLAGRVDRCTDRREEAYRCREVVGRAEQGRGDRLALEPAPRAKGRPAGLSQATRLPAW